MGDVILGRSDENENRRPEDVLGSMMASILGADSARERSELVREGLHTMARTVVAVILFSLLLAVGVLEILIGAMNIGSCPIRPLIPIWLVVAGSVSSLRNITGILLSVWDDKSGRIAAVRELLIGIFAAFWIIWLILGSYWTYGIYNDVVYDEGKQNYCDQLTYKFTFGIITLTYVIVGVLLCCCCYCIVCLCCHNGAVIIIT
ncbi:hypothetical protein RB195_012546 [Necator americanus]|uniref:Transmembrane protein n=1 Tax=Necator americanus TaxID=51031 RepID=A0ABR1DSV8_NECAM